MDEEAGRGCDTGCSSTTGIAAVIGYLRKKRRATCNSTFYKTSKRQVGFGDTPCDGPVVVAGLDEGAHAGDVSQLSRRHGQGK